MAIKSNSKAQDHNDLLRAFASKYKMPKDEVISNAVRLYWRPGNPIIISPVRKIDEEWINFHQKEFDSIMKNWAKIKI